MSKKETMTFDTQEIKEAKPKATRQQKEKAARRRRQDVDALGRGRLGIDTTLLDTENFQYRWIENSPERLNRATVQDDYDLVTHDDVHATNGDDSYIRRNGGQYGMVLARKPREYFVEDQKKKYKELDKTDSFIRQGGKAAEQLGDKGYAPAEAMKFIK